MGIEIFAERAKKLREENNYTQRQLAEMLGITNPAITYYESSRREPTLSILKGYARIFNVSLDYLVGLSDERR